MRKYLIVAALLVLFAPCTGSQAADDPLKDITIHKHPADFAEAQQLAVQNREERMANLQESMACVQRATKMDDLADCQKAEGKGLAVINLSYCDTGLSWPNSRKNKGGNGGKSKIVGQGTSAQAQPDQANADNSEFTACELAMYNVTGKKPEHGTPDEGKPH